MNLNLLRELALEYNSTEGFRPLNNVRGGTLRITLHSPRVRYIELASIMDGGNRDIILYEMEPAVTRNHSHHSNCEKLCGLELGKLQVYSVGVG